MSTVVIFVLAMALLAMFCLLVLAVAGLLAYRMAYQEAEERNKTLLRNWPTREYADAG